MHALKLEGWEREEREGRQKREGEKEGVRETKRDR